MYAMSPVGRDSQSPHANRPYHHGDLPRALKEAAVALVRERGPRGFSLREAATRAGVSSAAPYRHFADREELLAAVAEDGFRKLEEQLHRTLRKAPATEQAALEALAVAYVKFATANVEQFTLMWDPDLRTPERASLAEAAASAMGVLTAQIQQAEKSGLFSGLTPIDAATQVWSLWHGISILANNSGLRRAGQRTRPERLAVQGLRRLLHGDN
jgi:AcrR family transcriptional regulator